MALTSSHFVDRDNRFQTSFSLGRSAELQLEIPHSGGPSVIICYEGNAALPVAPERKRYKYGIHVMLTETVQRWWSLS